MAKKEKRNIRRLKGILVLLVGLLVISLAFNMIYSGLVEIPGFENEAEKTFGEQAHDLLTESEIFSIGDFVEIDIDFPEEGVILLINKENRCEGMIVAIDPNQAFSIQQGMDSQVSFRPTSHDTARDILEQYGIEVVMVQINELRGGAYLGRLVLDDGEKIVNLDVRPSDGIAIAVRTQAPIYLSKSLLDEYGENIC